MEQTASSLGTIELPIQGMTCQHCSRSVQAALANTPGVHSASVDLAGNRAEVTVDIHVDRAALIKAVERAGYRVAQQPAAPALAQLVQLSPTSPARIEVERASPEVPQSGAVSHTNDSKLLLNIAGMHCASCVGRVEEALSKMPGVSRAQANLATDQATVEFDPGQVSADQLLQAVASAGYSAQPAGDDAAGSELAERTAQELSAWRKRLLLGVLLLAPLLAMHFVHSASNAIGLLELLLATVLQLFVGRPFLTGAWRRLRHGSTNMDSLIALGTSAAYLAGVHGWWSSHYGMYFMDAGMILVFITLGKYLEAAAKRRASSAIRKLLELAPPEALVLRDGRTVQVSSATVAVGETIVVRPGAKTPLDALVLSGQSTVDQSWLTGESLPADKSPGDEILTGSINGQGALTARVMRPAGKTALAQVIELVRRAQESKTDVQRLADRVVRWFVPVVLALATVTLLAWGATGDWPLGLSSAVAVLVVACPCALGLATPTAIIVASGRGAELGILIKEAHAWELAGRVTTVVLDKTGTITLGKLQLAQLAPAPGVSADELLATAAAAERLSGHPLGAPIVSAAEARELRIPVASGLQVVAGQGILAVIDGHEVLVGNDRLLTTHAVDYRQQRDPLKDIRDKGQTPLLVARAGKLLGIIVVADHHAAHSREAVQLLHQRGLKVLLLSGDHAATANQIAQQAGIAQVRAELLPGDKLAIVEELRRSGQVVAMVGDGINDAPALAAADLGIAMGSGADIALESADVVITGHDLRAVVRCIALGQATLRTIKQNLVWAFAYNLLLLPIAAGALVPCSGIRLPAAAAAAAMALSSVSVVGNSLLLRRRKLS